MLINFEVSKLKMINDLARIATATQSDKIDKYIMELSAKDKCIYIEQYNSSTSISVSMKIDDPDIKEDAEIPIYDTDEFNDILELIDDDKIDISKENNEIKIITTKDNIKLPIYERTSKEQTGINSLKSLFTNRNYGNEKCYFIGHIDEKTKKPIYEATAKVDLNSINLKKIRKIFNTGLINVIVKDGNFIISIGTGKREQDKSITRVISKKDTKDPMKTKGNCSMLIKDINCFNLLAGYEGYTLIDMKKDVPLVVKRVFSKERIGVCYIVSIREET